MSQSTLDVRASTAVVGPTSAAEAASTTNSPTGDVSSLRDLSGAQWRSGIAAWLGWLFDGLDMHLYTLVATPFVALLLVNSSASDVSEKSGFIQGAFLVGWALGGGLFGRIGDRLGRSRALSLTILTYALFTGLAFFVTTWWQLMICRFLAALGIGGEWAVGSSLLSETWPRKWRAWIAAVLQTGVNLGVLAACVAVYVLKTDGVFALLQSIVPDLSRDFYLRAVFLVGVVPAFLVFWIRKHVPEPAEWQHAKAQTADAAEPGLLDLFRGDVRSTTLRTIGVCAFALTGWWAFMFWHVQHLRKLPSVAAWTDEERTGLVTVVFFLVIGISMFGNFFAAWLARRLGYRRAVAVMCLLFGLAIAGAYYTPRSHESLVPWLMAVGFCSGVFGLFTMYLPPLFPTLLRTTGAGFSYNVGRIAAAAGTILFAFFSHPSDLRPALLFVSLLFLPAALIALTLPDLRDSAEPS